jgi:hypothetical protein
MSWGAAVSAEPDITARFSPGAHAAMTGTDCILNDCHVGGFGIFSVIVVSFT